MQPSSLVFVAILVGWAVYLLPQWVRRREAFGQSHGQDRDSAGMRLLSRRHRATGGPSTTPLLPDPRALGEPVVDPLAAPADDADPDPADADDDTDDVIPERSPSALAAERRLRVLLLLIVLTITTWTVSLVAPFVAVAGWTSTALLALDVGALIVTGRQRAVRRAEARRAHVERLRRHRELIARRDAEDARRSAAAAATAKISASAEVGPVAGPSPAPRPERASERVARELDEAAASAAWTPVPVPPPTYTLKPAVHRPEPAPLDLPEAPPPQPSEPAASAAPAATGTERRTPRPWDQDRTFADDLDLDAVLARRRAVNG